MASSKLLQTEYYQNPRHASYDHKYEHTPNRQLHSLKQGVDFNGSEVLFSQNQ